MESIETNNTIPPEMRVAQETKEVNSASKENPSKTSSEPVFTD